MNLNIYLCFAVFFVVVVELVTDAKQMNAFKYMVDFVMKQKKKFSQVLMIFLEFPV